MIENSLRRLRGNLDLKRVIVDMDVNGVVPSDLFCFLVERERALER